MLFSFASLRLFKKCFEWVWTELAPDQQKKRYNSRSNITMEFLDDLLISSEDEWLTSDFVFDFNGRYWRRNGYFVA